MSIDKWFSKRDVDEEKIKRDKKFQKLSMEEVQELKKKKVRDLVHRKSSKSVEVLEEDDLLLEIIEFKNWLNHRTYLKGDREKIEVKVTNLYSKIKSEHSQKAKLKEKSERRQLIKNYKEIPVEFLDEKTRIAVSKIIHSGKKTNTDHYYLRKLKKLVQEKLFEAKYYEILDKILKL